MNKKRIITQALRFFNGSNTPCSEFVEIVDLDLLSFGASNTLKGHFLLGSSYLVYLLKIPELKFTKIIYGQMK